MRVRNLKIPNSLAEVIRNGGLQIDPTLAKAMFPLGCVVQPIVYSYDGLMLEDRDWTKEARRTYLGARQRQYSPGDIDPKLSVLIGDLGPDSPIALDYRSSINDPSIIYLIDSNDGNSYWVAAGFDVSEFLSKLTSQFCFEAAKSPFIKEVDWGRLVVEGFATMRDAKVFPGGAREWDWKETGTHHVPGIQPEVVQELIAKGSEVIVLSRGMQLALQASPDTLDMLRDLSIKTFVDETRKAVLTYNKFVSAGVAVGGLFHSTC